MTRFKIAYELDKELTPDELKKLDLKDKKIKITDTLDELPDIIIEDKAAAQKYLDYMNRPADEKEINEIVMSIKRGIESINDLNFSLVKPEKIIIGEDEDGELVYQTPVKEQLFHTGYRMTIKNKTENIHTQLNQLKRKLTEK